MSKLVVVESPSKAKTIQKYLGKDYKVLATVGHIIDLPKSKLGVDLEKSYKPQFVTIKGKAAVIKKLRSAIPDDEDVYLAMDPDREGEAIAWHAAKALKLKKPKRVVFHEITKSAVLDAIGKPRKINDDLVQAQIARRVLDRLVGYRVSEVLWQKIWYGLSAGRVQSVALRLIVEREREIEAFIPEEFWKVNALCAHKPHDIKPELEKKNSEKYTVPNEDEYKDIQSQLKGSKLVVSDVKTKDVKNSPYPPLTTSKLQQSGNNMFGYSAKRTMGIAQALYQNGHITYMRTDSVYMSDQAIDAIRDIIAKTYGKEYLPKDKRFYKNKSKSAQEAHEAIRPTDFKISKAFILEKYGVAEAKIYELIYNRAVASQMNDKISERLSIKLEAKGSSGDIFGFKLGAEKVLFDGFRKVLGGTASSKNADNPDEVVELEDIKLGQEFKIKKIEGLQNFTKPKPRFTEASLVKTLEEHGIGRPSTYATIISTVQDRGYVVKESNSLRPLDVGIVVNGFLEKNFARLVDYEYTANVEDGLDAISEGKQSYKKLIDAEFQPLLKEMELALKNVNKDDVVILGDSDEKCEKCGSDMIIRLGRYGKFLSCATFPKCNGMKSIDGGEESIDYEKFHKPENCPKCSGEIELKSGKYGQFWACKNYPECKGTIPMLLNRSCPECGKHLVERKSKWGKMFTGCSGYPDCKYIDKTKKADKKDSDE